MNTTNKYLTIKRNIVLFFGLLTALAVKPLLYADSGVKEYTGIDLTVSSLPEAKLAATQSFTVPFLQGEHFLVQDNNIKFSLKADLSPVSMNASGEAVFTPIAFFQLSAGALAGSGWNVVLFGGDVKGIGINKDGASGPEVDGSAFDGFFGKWHAGGALQFDTGAVFPGDWNHVLMRTYHEINYMSYSRAAPGDSWFYENDDGENQNGFNYRANYVVGYQMPLFLNTVALMAETRKYLYNTPGGNFWGDALGRWEFSAILNFRINDWFSAALITQCRTRRNYIGLTSKQEEKSVYYRNRDLDDDNPLRFEFYRVAAIMTFRLNSTE
ncbi:MAG: hypothetical protein LBD48_15265 [Treponema sp.]|jgi:hypothetical protein|nr:hypothetical protein [Treponema sp.]